MIRFATPLALLALLALAAAPTAQAQSCSPITITWPDAENPIWEMTALPPSLSTPSWPGSGLEIRDVRYRGRLVMKTGHIPMINVRYETGCGCYRDWMNSNTRFAADNVTGTCFAEPDPGTSQTMCDVGQQSSDVGSFTGIAMEDFGDGFTLVTQSQAGWYRYDIRWTFEEDGTIRPEFGFSNTTNNCATNARWHHVYWRFDFDIEEAEGNSVWESRSGGSWQQITNETTQLWDNAPGSRQPTRWMIQNNESERGYVITASELEYQTPANPETGNPTFDTFAQEDFAVSRYRLVGGVPQTQDNRNGCAVDFHGGSTPIIQNQDVTDHDLVVWWRTGYTKEGGLQEGCTRLGPVLTPVGDWGQNPVSAETPAAPAPVTLEAFPNPFDRTATVRFAVEHAQPVTIELFDTRGRLVRTLFEGQAAAGSTLEVPVEAGDLPNGIYTVRLTGERGVSGTTRVVLLR